MSGGGPNGVIQLGMLKTLHEAGVFRLSDLKSIYATSAGAILATFILLDVNLDDVCNYIVKRPWEKWIKMDFFALNENRQLHGKSGGGSGGARGSDQACAGLIHSDSAAKRGGK